MSDETDESGRIDVRRAARDAGPIVSALVALIVAVGGSWTGTSVAAEVRALRETVIRLEGKVAAAEGVEARLRGLELEVAALKASHKGDK